MKGIKQHKIAFFQITILEWYEKNKRFFPWREEDASDYLKLVSEVLLQRTKAETASKFLPTFLKKFPSWKAIANAEIEEIEETLKPIGLYRQRAPRLKKMAQALKRNKYIIPSDREYLGTLPMFGQYITNAAMLLVHEEPHPLLDVNMARVLERFFGERKLADIRYDPYLQKLALDIVTHKNSKEINWGVLDFAALVCTARKPRCEICPIKQNCFYLNGK
jgi:A/G-specific adenine glycosylase